MLVAGSLLFPAAVSGLPDDSGGGDGASADLFTVEEDVASMVVVFDSDRNMQVVWVSDPNAEIVAHDGTPMTATWAGELTHAQMTAASDRVGDSRVTCDHDVHKPRKERGQYHTFVKAKSRQECWGDDLEWHETTLNMQSRNSSNEFFYTWDSDEASGYPSRGSPIRAYTSHQCVLRGPYDWRSEGWGTVYFEDDYQPYYLPVQRTRAPYGRFCR